jgi:hypothetical protein
MLYSHKTSFYLTVFFCLVLTVSYCLTVCLIWPSVGEYRGWKDYAVKKERLVREIGETPKIILDGGSATLYGIRAKDVQRAFGLPTVNLALCAGFDLDYIFYRLKKMAKRGDVVILPLEYEHFLYAGGTSSFKASYILSNDREFFVHELRWSQKLEYLRHIMGFNKVFKAVKKSLSRRLTPWPLGMLNDNGDITENLGKQSLAGMGPVPVQPGEIKETEGLMLIKNFSRWAKENGVTVYLSYANRVYSKDYEGEEYARYFENLRRYLIQNNMVVLGTPYDFFFPEDLFYNTLYHLNETGVTLRTKNFIRMLANTNPELFKVLPQPPGSTGPDQNPKP